MKKMVILLAFLFIFSSITSTKCVNNSNVVAAIETNSPIKLADKYIAEMNTQNTIASGLISFIPEVDGYYDIRTDGANIDIGAVLTAPEPVYGADGYEPVRVRSSAGASTLNKWTYNLKAGVTYSLQLEVISGSGSYSCTIERLDNIFQSPEIMHNEPLMLKVYNFDFFTPIKWVGNVLVTTTASDPDWFDYRATENRWANAMLQDGSMFVWVPRYAYRIIPDSDPGNIYSNKIEIKYLSGLSNVAYDGTLCKTVAENPDSGDFIVHPGFTHGGDTYSGLWVAKFQASSDGEGGNNDDERARFVSDAPIWRKQSMKNVLQVVGKMNDYVNPYWMPAEKTVADMHLLKNSEWAAVAYLAYSTAYNTNAGANKNPAYVTGGGNFINNASQSTSHNVYGIYDMSGGGYEFVAAYSGEYSGKAGVLADLDKKYVDVIGSNDTGHAISEVAGWFGDSYRLPIEISPLRGYYAAGTGNNDFGFFAIKSGSLNNSDENSSWRAAIWLPGVNLSTKTSQDLKATQGYSDRILNNPYTGRMEYTGIYADDARYNDMVLWNGEKLPPRVVNADLFWDKIMPKGTIEAVNGEIKVTGELDKEYIEGTKKQLASHSPRLGKWRSENVNVVIRVILDEPVQDARSDISPEDDKDGYEIPKWLIDKVGFDKLYTEYQYDYDKNAKKYLETSYQPNYSNEMLIAAHEHLIKKLAEAYNDDPFVTFVQIGSIGRWGEWNEESDGVYTDRKTSVSIPNAKTADRYLKPYIKYFTKKELSMRYPHDLGKKYGVGIHDDTIASNYELNNFFERAHNISRLANEYHSEKPYYWQNSFVHGETSSNFDGKWSWFSNDLPTERAASKYQLENIKYIDNTLKQIEKMHLSFFKFAISKKDTPDNKEADVAENMKKVLKILGARLWVSDISANSVFEKGSTQEITLLWNNDGIAPFNFDWDVEISLLDPTGKPVATVITNPVISRCMPGQSSIQSVSFKIPEGTSTGVYNIAAAVLSPYTNKPELELANSGASYSKRYELQAVTVK